MAYAPTRAKALGARKAFAKRFGPWYPKAVERVERAIEAHIGYVVFVRHTFAWENLRFDPRMDEILAAVGL